jgi:hypothetical protein
MMVRALGLLLAVVWATGCGHRPAALRDEPRSISPASSALDLELAGRSRTLPESPRSDEDVLARRFLLQELRKHLYRVKPGVPQVLLQNSNDVSPRVVPPEWQAGILLLTRDELRDLARRHGSVEYWHLSLSRESFARISMTVGLSLAQPEGGLVLCCHGRTEIYEKRGEQWLLVEGSDYDV